MPVGASTKMSAPEMGEETKFMSSSMTHREPQPQQFPAASLCIPNGQMLGTVTVRKREQ
jgi:hypothetical protein